jgi:hypothetical protein
MSANRLASAAPIQTAPTTATTRAQRAKARSAADGQFGSCRRRSALRFGFRIAIWHRNCAASRRELWPVLRDAKLDTAGDREENLPGASPEYSRTKTKSPQTNGTCERFHKTVVQLLEAIVLSQL